MYIGIKCIHIRIVNNYTLKKHPLPLIQLTFEQYLVELAIITRMLSNKQNPTNLRHYQSTQALVLSKDNKAFLSDAYILQDQIIIMF